MYVFEATCETETEYYDEVFSDFDGAYDFINQKRRDLVCVPYIEMYYIPDDFLEDRPWSNNPAVCFEKWCDQIFYEEPRSEYYWVFMNDTAKGCLVPF